MVVVVVVVAAAHTERVVGGWEQGERVCIKSATNVQGIVTDGGWVDCHRSQPFATKGKQSEKCT